MPNYRDYVKSLPLMEALWWFIENRAEIGATDIFFDLRERYREQQQNPDLIAAVKSLVSDIEGMQDGINQDWFGNFSESQEVNEQEGVSIEWTNLRISLDAVNAELAKLPAEQGILGNKTTLMIVDEIEALSQTADKCSVCGQPQVNSPAGVTCENGHGGAPAAEGTRFHGSERDLDWNEPFSRSGGRSGYDF